MTNPKKLFDHVGRALEPDPVPQHGAGVRLARRRGCRKVREAEKLTGGVKGRPLWKKNNFETKSDGHCGFP